MVYIEASVGLGTMAGRQREHLRDKETLQRQYHHQEHIKLLYSTTYFYTFSTQLGGDHNDNAEEEMEPGEDESGVGDLGE